MIDTVYKKKDVIISAGLGSGKNVSYQLILLIKEEAIVLGISPTIVLITDQMCLSVITVYYKL